jgi:hypothetical protein
MEVYHHTVDLKVKSIRYDDSTQAARGMDVGPTLHKFVNLRVSSQRLV